MARDIIKGARILVVEDEAMIALDLQVGLEDVGAEVIGPVFSMNGAREVDLSEVDAAVLDVFVQDEEVYPLAERLQAAGIPFLFHSGHAGLQRASDRFASIPLVAKPATSGQIVDTLAREIADGRGCRAPDGHTGHGQTPL